MSLIRLHGISLRYSGPALLDGVSFHLEERERVALVGRNGEGKSTLFRIIAGTEKADAGDRILQPGLRLADLPQSVPRDLHGPVIDVVQQGADPTLEEWDAHQRATNLLERMALPAESLFETLSGGSQRRVLLARALIRSPDVLLLDEPTNHLDVPAIEGLEQLLLGFRGAVLFITHDRTFLRRIATRIVELDRGRLTRFDGDYERYLSLREEQREAEEKARALFDKKLQQEETWIRQGVKARRTRAMGRVHALERMREERRARRDRAGLVRLDVEAGPRSGQKVIEAEDASYAWSGTKIVDRFSARILRGDKIGIIGPNGCGKTTLLRMLLGQLAPQQGRVELGTKLEVAYFDQHREALNEEATVADNASPASEYITINGKRRHVISYLEDFLFPPERSRSPVKILSGGERNRLLLARLFARPFNLLVMDEPTNDLDAETLELLENLLVERDGTLLLVSHDRSFLNNVVTSTLVFEGSGRIAEYAGGYDDWLRQRPSAAPAEPVPAAAAPTPSPARKSAKWTLKLQAELDRLPARIEALEHDLKDAERRLANASALRGPPDELTTLGEIHGQLTRDLEVAFARWAELDRLRDECTTGHVGA